MRTKMRFSWCAFLFLRATTSLSPDGRSSFITPVDVSIAGPGVAHFEQDIVEPGYVDLSGLRVSYDGMDARVDAYIYTLPESCATDEYCDVTKAGVGVMDEASGTTYYCCTSDLVEKGLCSTANTFIYDPTSSEVTATYVSDTAAEWNNQEELYQIPLSDGTVRLTFADCHARDMEKRVVGDLVWVGASGRWNFEKQNPWPRFTAEFHAAAYLVLLIWLVIMTRRSWKLCFYPHGMLLVLTVLSSIQYFGSYEAHLALLKSGEWPEDSVVGWINAVAMVYRTLVNMILALGVGGLRHTSGTVGCLRLFVVCSLAALMLVVELCFVIYRRNSGTNVEYTVIRTYIILLDLLQTFALVFSLFSLRETIGVHRLSTDNSSPAKLVVYRKFWCICFCFAIVKLCLLAVTHASWFMDTLFQFGFFGYYANQVVYLIYVALLVTVWGPAAEVFLVPDVSDELELSGIDTDSGNETGKEYSDESNVDEVAAGELT